MLDPSLIHGLDLLPPFFHQYWKITYIRYIAHDSKKNILILIKSFHTISSLSAGKVLRDSKPKTQYLDK